VADVPCSVVTAKGEAFTLSCAKAQVHMPVHHVPLFPTFALGRAKMPTGSYGPQQLKDSIVQNRVHRERDQFIAAIHEDDIRRLASSHHNGDHCSFFKPPSRGSYNICYFVRFPSNSSSEDVEKRVVRFLWLHAWPMGAGVS
jgi:hypothetical protein